MQGMETQLVVYLPLERGKMNNSKVEKKYTKLVA